MTDLLQDKAYEVADKILKRLFVGDYSCHKDQVADEIWEVLQEERFISAQLICSGCRKGLELIEDRHKTSGPENSWVRCKALPIRKNTRVT